MRIEHMREYDAADKRWEEIHTRLVDGETLSADEQQELRSLEDALNEYEVREGLADPHEDFLNTYN